MPPLPHPIYRKQDYVDATQAAKSIKGISEQELPLNVDHSGDQLPDSIIEADGTVSGGMSVRTALCVEPRDGRLHIFLPPVESLEDYLEIVSAVEATADHLQMPVVVEGYLPPSDARLNNIKVTPDPGVIEVNIHPADNWSDLVANTTTLYEEARLTRLGTEKFDLDGKHSGTGGGNHLVIGAATPLDSPFLRRPDLLRSLITYWNNHPIAVVFIQWSIYWSDQSSAARRRRTFGCNLRITVGMHASASAGQLCATVAGRSYLSQFIDRLDRQHASRRVLHRQTLFTR